MGAPNGVVLPEFFNFYKLPFYLATRMDGEAILTKKLHRKGVLPKDVNFLLRDMLAALRVVRLP